MRKTENRRMADQFNRLCPIGTHVIYWPGVREGDGRASVTRSAAWVIGGHSPAVRVEGYAGAIALTHVMSYPAPVDATSYPPKATR